MSNTLRRKMFSLGGKASKSHGVGLTHGLKFNKGGNVQASYGVGNNANKKVGPDGQVREAHNAFFAAGKGLYGLGKSVVGLPALKAMFQGAKSGSTKPISNFIKGTTGPVKGKFGTTAELLSGNPGLRSQLLRAAQVVAPGGGVATLAPGLTMAALDRAGVTEKSDKDSKLESIARDVGKFGLDYSIPGALLKGSGYLTETETNKKEKSLYNLLSGNESVVEKSVAKKTATNETDNYVNMKSDAEKRAEMMYKAMGGGANFDYSTVSNALLQAAPFVAEGEYAKALTAAGTSVNNEVAADKELQQQISGTIIEQEIASDMADDDMIRKMVAEGNYENAFEARRALQASDQTDDVAMAKYDNKDQLDVELMNVGKVYTDVKNASGDLFVVKNSSGQVQSFNRYEEALAYAET